MIEIQVTIYTKGLLITGGGRNGEEDFSFSPGCLWRSCRSEGNSQPSFILRLYPPSGLWSWFLSTISHSNHIFMAFKKSATACSRVWDHRCLLLFFSGRREYALLPGNMLPTCPCPLTWAGFFSGQDWVGGTVRE